jgi:Flp pilus assembly protein TadG
MLRHRVRGKEEGQDLVEFALMLPLVLLLLLGIVDFSLAFMSWNTLANAVREGARAAVVLPLDVTSSDCIGTSPDAASSVATIEGKVVGFGIRLGLQPGDVVVTCAGSGAVTVTVSNYSYQLITGSMIAVLDHYLEPGGSGTGIGNLTLRARATMQHE